MTLAAGANGAPAPQSARIPATLATRHRDHGALFITHSVRKMLRTIHRAGQFFKIWH
jgi:hypothetical protein